MTDIKNLDFIAIGETTVDAFIRLSEAEVRCDADNTHCKLCLDYGAKIPYDSVVEIPAVGNAANASVSASRLGLSSALMAHVGKDANGEKCIEALQKDHVITDYVAVDEDKNTNYHYILWFDKDRTILQKHSDFPYVLPDIGNPKWVYLTSLGEKSMPFHNDVSAYLEKHPDIKMAFQPGIFQIKFGTEQLKKIYAQTEVFFCNVEEAQTILNETSRDLPTLLRALAALGPKKIFVTDGIDGAYAYDGVDMWFMPVYPHEPYERTGAGDAFASTVISALIIGKTLEEAFSWGPINSMSVVQKVGAQEGLLSREKLEEFLAKAPKDYKVRKI